MVVVINVRYLVVQKVLKVEQTNVKHMVVVRDVLKLDVKHLLEVKQTNV
jgi:hypothetical protein